MEGVTQMAKPRLWPARSHPRASYMSAGASWPRRRRRAGARRAGGRASQSRRPTPPPTAPPAPNGAGPGGRGADPLLRPLPPPAASSPGSAVGAFPARALHAPVGRGRRNRGVPAGCLGRGGRIGAGRVRRRGAAPPGGCPGAGLRCRRDARGRGMEAGTGETEAARPPNPPRTGHSGTEPSAVADGITLVGKRQKETNARLRIERPRPDPVPQRSAGPGAGAALPGTVRGVSLPVGQRRRSFYFPSPLDSLNGLIIRSQLRASGRACPGAAPHSGSAAAAAGLSSGSSRKAPRDPSALGAEKEKKKNKKHQTKPKQNRHKTKTNAGKVAARRPPRYRGCRRFCCTDSAFPFLKPLLSEEKGNER